MAKFLVTADLHIHNRNGRLPIYERLLDDITGLALAHKADGVIIAGDVWDEKHGVNVAVLTLLYEKLWVSRKAGLPWTLLRGNHEIAMKSEPHDTLLNLFRGVADVIVKPRLRTIGDACIAFLPWYPGEDFVKYCKTLAEKAQASAYRVFIGHIGIDEGQISPSNYYRVPQRVSLKHLKPSIYDLILLGDYHLKQFLAEHVLYLGTPIPQNFADEGTQGVWLLQIGEGPPSLTELGLLHEYPQFFTHTPITARDLEKVDFSKNNHKLRVESATQEDYSAWAALPNVTIDPFRGEVTSKLVRLESVRKEVVNLEEIFLDYSKHTKLPTKVRELGIAYLKRARELVYR